MKRYFTAVAAGIVGMTVAVSANALTITQNASVMMQPTNWSDSSSLTFNTFDTNLGVLDSITFTLHGTVNGDLKAESLDASPSVITLTLSALINVNRPDTTNILNVAPSTSQTFNASAFDGTVDFGGTSGVTFSGLSAMAMKTITDFGDLALFSTMGAGSIILLSDAEAQSNGSGAGNLITQFSTQAGADLEVVYNYHVDPPRQVPEPAGLALFGAGLTSLGFVRRKRAANKSRA